MIESLFTSQTSTDTQRVLTYVKNERMGGYVPKYEYIKATPKSTNEIDSENLLAGAQGQDTLSFQSTSISEEPEDQFGFADLVDMVNPLHHVPVVGHVYRELTGDEIKPISRIMGGAAFSGPLGVATALIDTVITEETGRTMTENAIGFAFNQEEEHIQIAEAKTPETAIENAINQVNDYEMATTLLTYSDLGKQDDKILKYEAYKRAEETMAQPLEREPITQVSFSQKGGLYAL